MREEEIGVQKTIDRQRAEAHYILNNQ